MRRTVILALSGAALSLSVSFSVQAQQEIKIGVITPLTGATASTGAEIRNAFEFAADIINNGTKDIPELPFSSGGGLPGLKGAKIKLVFADHQNNPQTGAAEAERLISQEKVVALIGSYQSHITAATSQTAERFGIPFLNADSSSVSLTTRGFKWFFRITPTDNVFVTNFYDFLKELEAKKNFKIGPIATFNANVLWGNESTKLEAKLTPEKGYKLVKQVNYPDKSTQLTAEVQALKAAAPSVVIQSSYLPDAILSMKTYKELGFMPDMILANGVGFTDTEFIRVLGKDAEFVITREVWALDLAARNPLIKQVNDLYYNKYKANFTGNSSRSFTGLIVMADAINRAASTEPEKIRKALTETKMGAESLIMPWKGVKFDENGQNVLARGIMVQVVDGKYHTVYPFNLASRDVIWPMPKWNERK